MRRLATLAALAACGSPPPPPAHAPSNASADEPGRPAGRPAALAPDCWLGDDRCVIELDLDGDGRADRLETVVGPTRAKGFWITLATGRTQQVGAGVALPAPAATDEDSEPIPLDADLGGLRALHVARHAPCAGDGLVLSGGDAAAVLCWVGGTAAAYHLGF